MNRETSRRPIRAALAVALTGIVGAILAPAAFSGSTHSGAPADAIAGSTRLPGVGHDAVYTAAPCPNPLIPGVPLELGPTFRCGYLTVPENRFRPGGRKLQIAVAIARAATRHPKADPLLWLEGGPGGTGLAAANRIVAEGVNADRDVIFVDQRGTLKSHPLLSCPGYDAFLIRSFGMAPGSAANRRQTVSSVATCRRTWVSRGYDVSSFNTSENAADMADLRVALGIKSWNVYGVSYGSDLALQYLRDYPAGIRTEVLDSVLPPQINVATGFWANAARGYRNVFAACDAAPSCHAAYPHLHADLVTAVKRLTRRPLTLRVMDPASHAPTKVVFDGFQFANLLVVMSLTPGSIVQMPALVHEMANRQGAEAATRLLSSGLQPGLAGDGLAFTVFCSEDVAFTTHAKALAAARKALPDFPDRVLSLSPQLGHLFALCRAWKVKPAKPGARAPAHSRIPVLEFSGDADAIISLAWAKVAARSLPHARILTFPGLGHGVVTWSQCGANILVGFLNRPRGGYSTKCAARLPRGF